MKHQYVLTPVIMQIDSRGSGPMDITLVDDNEDAVVLRLAVNDVATRYESQINRRTITATDLIALVSKELTKIGDDEPFSVVMGEPTRKELTDRVAKLETVIRDILHRVHDARRVRAIEVVEGAFELKTYFRYDEDYAPVQIYMVNLKDATIELQASTSGEVVGWGNDE